MAVKKLKEGDKAPDFILPNQDGKKFKLSQFRGKKNVVLYFYPKDLTPGCTQEACDFTAHQAKFSRKDAVILGVSFDDEKRHQKFIEKNRLGIDLLADVDKKVADLYGVHQMKSFMGRKFMGIVRSTFLIDKQGKIQKIFPQVKVKGHVEEVLNSL
jgi:peroxiredoxin Q/BCP